MVEKGIAPSNEVNMHKVGMVFYAIIEEMQRLTVEFRLWLEAQEAHKKNSKRGKAGADARWNGKDKPDGFDVQEELD